MKYELNDEELNEVSGGQTIAANKNCQYFVVAPNKLNINKCANCTYYHKIQNRYFCSNTKAKKVSNPTNQDNIL